MKPTQDKIPILAMDKSQRHYDDNNHLIVDSTIITKAAVNPYYGHEIPNHEALGLNPDKIYQLLRDPVELQKGMHTFGEKQLLLKHIFVSADDPQKEMIAGTIGSNLEMVGDDVKGSLTVWDKEAINLIESGKLAELSASYFYDPDMTAGTFNGELYDGIMRNIRGNHVALVERGRIGRDALVADALPKSMEFNMKMKKGALAKINAAAKKIMAKKGIAMDADLSPDEIKELVAVAIENTEHVVDDNDQVEKLIGADNDKTADDEDDEEKTADDEDEQTRDDRDNESEAMRLKEREKREEKDRNRDKREAAMDAAIKTASDAAVKQVTQLFEARELVKPLVGVVAMDSAESVLKYALMKSNVDHTGISNVEGLTSMVKMAIAQKAQPKVAAMDSASYEDDPLTNRFK